MRYPIAVETGDAKHAFGVVVPDLPGCFSAGDTLDEALTNSREAILLHHGRTSGRRKAVPRTIPHWTATEEA
jgi:predicted RNase H-like HicB family nuclease